MDSGTSTVDVRGGGGQPAQATAVTINQPLSWISWRVILAGVATALVTQLLLNMLGVAIGMATIDMADPTAMGIGAGLWWAISGIVAAFFGGWIAGLGVQGRGSGTLHGFLSWAVTTLIIAYLIARLLGGVVGMTASAVGTAGEAAGSVASTVAGAVDPNLGQIQQEVSQVLQNNPDAVSSVVTVVTSQNATDQQRAEAANALQAAGMSETEAQQRLETWSQSYRQAEQNVVQAADTAATGVSTGAFFSFVSLILGALAALLAGRWAAGRGPESFAYDHRR